MADGMTFPDVAAVLAIVRMEWPHSNLGTDAATITAYWHQILGRYSREDVEGAVKELIASGRDHAPGPGVVASVCAARTTDTPEFDEAWQEFDRLKNRWNPAFPGREVPPADAFSHPVLAAFAVPAWRELCTGPAPGTNGYGTFYAQQREAYRALAARATRDVGLAAIGAPRRRGELVRAGGLFAAEAARLLGPGK